MGKKDKTTDVPANPDAEEIGRTVSPTPAQAARYAELRDGGTPPHVAGRIVREEARQGKP